MNFSPPIPFRFVNDFSKTENDWNAIEWINELFRRKNKNEGKWNEEMVKEEVTDESKNAFKIRE